MKYHPSYIIYKQALRYLSDNDQQVLITQMTGYFIARKSFLTRLIKNFDVELFKTSPLIWQDIWLYNYIKYDVGDKLPKSGLIAKYEREAIVENDLEFKKKKYELNQKSHIIKLK